MWEASPSADEPLLRTSLRRHTSPLKRRNKSSVASLVQFAPFAGPASEAFSYPHEPDCAHCRERISRDQARSGVGLCDACFEDVPKSCCVCRSELHRQQLRWGSGLCNECYDTVDKECRLCTSELDYQTRYWRSGLCDPCYDKCKAWACLLCSVRLEPHHQHRGTGLCDLCYDKCDKSCRLCKSGLLDGSVRWGTGMCDSCYDSSEKTCRKCVAKISLGELRWGSGLCDACYDRCEKECGLCSQALEPESALLISGLCAECYRSAEWRCKMCKREIEQEQAYAGTGVCDDCYISSGKTCKKCEQPMSFGQLHWGSMLCDPCYDSFAKACSVCQSGLGLGEMHWGSGLCDGCYDSCKRSCSMCDQNIDLGQLHWGTGLCDLCYIHQQRAHQRRPAAPSTALSAGVWATMHAQFVFYFAPGLLAPSLYLQLQEVVPTHSVSRVYAAVLMAATCIAMMGPLVLGGWAQRRGEREVYAAVTTIAGIAGLTLTASRSGPAFAVAWGLLSTPPSLRGVRAAYFARHVPQTELGRVGQLSSASGLLGGMVGPLVATVLKRSLEHVDPNGEWPDAFVFGAVLAAIAHFACAITLLVLLPKPRKVTHSVAKTRSNASAASSREDICEQCSEGLTSREQQYPTRLCDDCYNSFGGSQGYSFRHFKRDTLWGFCTIVALLEFSANSAIIASFQPIAVGRFGWGADAIAMVNLAGAGLSVVVSLLVAYLRFPDKHQLAFAAGLYVTSVWIFTTPPLVEWRLVLGLMLGLKSQILFMAPFTATFSRLIGRVRVTNQLTTPLCFAPLVGACLGTMAAPSFLDSAGSSAFTLAALPASGAAACIALAWHRLGGSQKAAPGRHRSQTMDFQPPSEHTLLLRRPCGADFEQAADKP